MSEKKETTFNIMYDALSDLDNLALDISFATNSIFAIQHAMESKAFAAETFVPGLFSVFLSFERYSEKLTEAVQRAWDAAREDVRNEQDD